MKLNEATVLVVDDEPELLEIFSAWLERSGCRVLTAPNGAEALEILTEWKVDALISDLQMPIVDGMSLVRRIDERSLAIPSMLFVSGFGDVDVREVHALGVERLLEKPLRRRDLIGALERSLKEREELWLTPMAGPVARSIEMAVDGLDESGRAGTFELGRGGCCFRCSPPVAAGERICLTVRIAGSGVTVSAQCEVRWYCWTSGWAGVEFCYVEPEGRASLVDLIKDAAVRSFIPGSCGNGSDGRWKPVAAAARGYSAQGASIQQG